MINHVCMMQGCLNKEAAVLDVAIAFREVRHQIEQGASHGGSISYLQSGESWAVSTRRVKSMFGGGL